MALLIVSLDRAKSVHENISFIENAEIAMLILGSNSATNVVATIGIAINIVSILYLVLHLLIVVVVHETH